jgi:SagB-type dehydrogenase family enzyme
MRKTETSTTPFPLGKDVDLFCEFAEGNNNPALAQAIKFLYQSRVIRKSRGEQQETGNSSSGTWVEVDYKEYPRFPKVQLPDSSTKEFSLSTGLANRQSCRAFSRKSIDVSLLAEILRCVHADRSSSRYPSRAFPSAGGLYCAETYLIVRCVKNLTPGVYHYSPRFHSLHVIPNRVHAWKQASTALAQNIGSPAAFVVESVRLGPLISKYGLRGVRFALMEIGAAAEALDLAATSRGLATLWLGGFTDEEIGDLLGVSPLHELEIPLLILALGYRVPKSKTRTKRI